MEEDLKKKIEEITARMDCPKGFKCAKGGFERLCKTSNHFGLENHFDCLEEKPMQCPFAFLFGLKYLCQCPLRVYIAKNLKK